MDGLFEEDFVMFNGDYTIDQLELNENELFNYGNLKYDSESEVITHHLVSNVPSVDKTHVKKKGNVKSKKRCMDENRKKEKSLIEKCAKKESSLGIHARRLVNVLKSTDKSIYINGMAKELSIPRRRIYDIIHVLEGIGLVEKSTQRKVIWKGNSAYDEQKIKELKDENSRLKGLEDALNASINEANAALNSAVQENKKYGYVTSFDLKSLYDFEDVITIAVKMNPDIQFSQLDDFKLQIKSKHPVPVYVVNKTELRNIGYKESKKKLP